MISAMHLEILLWICKGCINDVQNIITSISIFSTWSVGKVLIVQFLGTKGNSRITCSNPQGQHMVMTTPIQQFSISWGKLYVSRNHIGQSHRNDLTWVGRLCILPTSLNRKAVTPLVAYRWFALCLITIPFCITGRWCSSCLSTKLGWTPWAMSADTA